MVLVTLTFSEKIKPSACKKMGKLKKANRVRKIFQVNQIVSFSSDEKK